TIAVTGSRAGANEETVVRATIAIKAIRPCRFLRARCMVRWEKRILPGDNGVAAPSSRMMCRAGSGPDGAKASLSCQLLDYSLTANKTSKYSLEPQKTEGLQRWQRDPPKARSYYRFV